MNVICYLQIEMPYVCGILLGGSLKAGFTSNTLKDKILVETRYVILILTMFGLFIYLFILFFKLLKPRLLYHLEWSKEGIIIALTALPRTLVAVALLL